MSQHRQRPGGQYMRYLVAKKGAIATTYAVVISIIVTMIVVSMSATLVQQTESITDMKENDRARYAVESGINFGLGAIQNAGAGYEVGGAGTPITLCQITNDSTMRVTLDYINPTPCIDPASGKPGQLIEYFVTSLAGIVDGYDNSPSPTDDRYIVPPPGEGDAGENCIRPGNFANTTHTVDENILKPCNWNRLYYGKAVAIPLYISVPPDAWNPEGVINPVDLPNGPPGFGEGLDSFTIKVRTPCSGGHLYDNGNLAGPDEDDWCLDDPTDTDNDARPELVDGEPSNNPAHFSPTDIIVHWQIVSTCNYELSDAKDGECIGIAVSPTEADIDPIVPYSDINKEAINEAREDFNYAVVGTLADFPRRQIDDLNVSGNNHPTIVSYLKNIFISAQRPPGTTSVTINRPVLYLSAVSPMTTEINLVYPEENEYVPYIEYQIETDQPISDSNFTIRATGKYGNHSESKKEKREIFNASPSFVFQN